MIIKLDDYIVKQNSLKAWFLAARPKTLSGAAVPVLIGMAYAWHTLKTTMPSETYQWLPAVLCLLFAFIMQIDANFVNDYFDCVKGRDNEQRLGPLRACQQGWVSLRAMRLAIIITSLLACAVGCPLIYYGGWQMIVIGALCLLFCFLYTTVLAGLGLGDVLVLIFFGIVPCCFTYYVIVPESLQSLALMPWNVGIATGLVVDTLLIVNNYRDIENDRSAGKRTLVVLLGKTNAEWLYLFLTPISIIMVIFEFGWSNVNILLGSIVYFIHIRTWSEMRRIGEGRELNKVLGKTARNIFLYGILITLLIILS